LWSSEHCPNVLLLRDPTSYGSATYLQRALETLCNLKAVHTLPPQVMYAFRKMPFRLRRTLLRGFVRASTASDLAFPQVDLLLVVDPLRLGAVPDGLAGCTAYYAIDSHIAFQEHVERARVADYDFVFVAQKDDIPRYRSAGCRHVEWLPHAFDPAIHRKIPVEKTRNVTFVGRLWKGTEPWAKDRWDVLRALQERMGLEIHTTFLHDLARIHSQSKIVFNRSLRGDLNMRVFEALGCGAFLLTDQIGNGMGELFADRVHLATYRTAEEAIEIAQYFLSCQEERETIALQGHRHVHAQHTYRHRSAALLKTCLGYVAPETAPASSTMTP